MLRRALSHLILLAALLVAVSGITAAHSDQAADIIESAIKAHGGREILEKVEVEGVRTGTLYVYKPAENKGKFIIHSHGEMTRADVDLSGIIVTIVFTGDSGWLRQFGQVTDISERDRKEQARALDHSITKLLDYEKPGYTVKYLGKSTQDGCEFLGVSITSDKGSATEFYFDSQTRLIAKMAYADTNLDTQNPSRYEATSTDYRTVDGVQIPFRTETSIDGIRTQVMQLATVDIDAPVPDDIFARPPTVKTTALAPVTVPCTYADHFVCVDVSVNGKEPAIFLLDTGAGITLIDTAYAKELGLPEMGKTQAATAGGTIDAIVTSIKSLKVGDAEVKDLMALEADMGKVGGIKGILGYSFLNNFQTTIDYAGRRLTFSDPQEPPSVPEGSYLVPIEIQGSTPHVNATLNGTMPVRMLVDTGAALSQIPYRAIDALKLTDIAESGVASGADGREITLNRLMLDSVTLGTLTIPKAEVTVPSQPDKTSDPTGSMIDSSGDGTLGNTLLERYTVTINYDHQVMVFGPCSDPEKMHLDSAGVPVQRAEVGISIEGYEGVVSVRAVTPGLSAEEAGVKAGDVILEIDGKPLPNLEAASPMLKGAPGTNVKLKVKRGQATLEFTLQRRAPKY